MHHPTDRIAHTTVFVSPVVEHWLEREIAQWIIVWRHMIGMFAARVDLSFNFVYYTI